MTYAEIHFSRDNAMAIYAAHCRRMRGFHFPKDPIEPVSAMIRVDDSITDDDYEVIVEGDILVIEDNILRVKGGGFSI